VSDRPGFLTRTLAGPTIALAAVTAATAVGMTRLFADWDYLRPMVLAVLGVHAACFLLRWARVPGWAAFPLGLMAALSCVGLAYHPETLALGLPTPTLIDALRLDLRLVFDQFPTAVAPVPSVGVFAVSAALLLAVCAVVADTFAFRAFGRLEAIVPAGLIFVFTSALGADRYRVQVTVLWLATALVCVAVLRAVHDHDDVAWLGRPRHDLAGAAVTAVLLAAVISFGAGFVAQRLPGAGEEPLVDTRNRIGDVTQVVSPLVDIRSRLVNRSDVTMMTVEASFASYWRVGGLSDFDGKVWRPVEQDLRSVDDLPSTPPMGTEINVQRITVGGLGGVLLPVAAEPIDATGRLRWADASGGLVVDGPALERGDTFDVASAVPRPGPDVLRATGSGSAPEGSLSLPPDVPREAYDLAVEVTAGQPTVYDRALALQLWFQNNFTYDLRVQLGHSDDAIREFLDIRRGYCEQFAGTFAVMARSLGIPARVAVGFTSGRETAPGRYQVLGRNAHAWAEVWFDGIGWVLFEPTPGRGAPGTEVYTQVPAAQDETAPGEPVQGTQGDQPTAPIEPSLTTVPGAITPATTVPAPAIDAAVAATTSVPVAPFVILGGITLAIAWFTAAPRLAARRHRPKDPSPLGRVDHAWRRTVDALQRAGGPSPAGATPTEYARRVERVMGIDGRSLRELARTVTTATFSPRGVDDIAATRSEVLAAELIAAAQGMQSGWARFVDRVTLR
jgi:transglutaminase-like putative cysteine protease